MTYSYIYIVYDHLNIFAILNDMDEATILCTALRASSINNRTYIEGNDQKGFYVEELKVSKNGICIGKQINTCPQTIVNEKKRTDDCVNIIDCIKIRKIDNDLNTYVENIVENTTDDENYVDEISLLEDSFDEAYGLKKKGNQKTGNQKTGNQKMDDPEYLKRCEEQTKRKGCEKEKERISVFRSGKSTYVKIKTKINKGTMRIIDISSLFADKYLIYDFMESKQLIKLTNISNDDHEYYIFRQLELVIESYWWEFNKNSIKNTDNHVPNPYDEMNPEYDMLFDEFYVFMDENGGVPKLEKDMHQHLNTNSDNHIFERDCSIDNYE